GVAAVALILGSVGGTWIAWHPLRAWYSTRCLAQASEAERAVWVERVAGLDKDALPGLLRCLSRKEPRACGNAQAALAALVDRWPAADPRRLELANQLAERFANLSFPGQQAALELQVLLLQALPSEESKGSVLPVLARLLAQAAHQPDPEVRAHALVLAATVLGQTQQADMLA